MNAPVTFCPATVPRIHASLTVTSASAGSAHANAAIETNALTHFAFIEIIRVAPPVERETTPEHGGGDSTAVRRFASDAWGVERAATSTRPLGLILRTVLSETESKSTPPVVLYRCVHVARVLSLLRATANA